MNKMYKVEYVDKNTGKLERCCKVNKENQTISNMFEDIESANEFAHELAVTDNGHYVISEVAQ